MAHACIVLPLSVYAVYFEGELPKASNCHNKQFIVISIIIYFYDFDL
jgi:hypothetical protein